MKNDRAKLLSDQNSYSLKFNLDEQLVPALTPYTLLCGIVRIAATLLNATAAVMWSAARGGRGALVTFYGLSDNDAVALDADAYSQTVGPAPVHAPDTGSLHIVSDTVGGLFINGETLPGCRIMVFNTAPIESDERLESILRNLADQATAIIGLPRRDVLTRTTVQRVSPPEPVASGSLDELTHPVQPQDKFDEFLDLFKAHPIPAFVFDASSLNIVAVNDAVVDQYGYTHDELIGMNIRSLRPPEDVTRLEMELARDSNGKNGRWNHIKKNGEKITVQIDHTSVVYQGQDCILSTTQDITARVATEAELKSSQERFRLVTENISDMIVMIDHDGNVRYVSPASSRLLGVAPEDLVGSHFIERIHPGDESRVIDALLDGFMEHGVSKPIEFRLRSANREWIKVEAIANNQFATPGLDAIVVAVRDVSRQERDASELFLREQALENVSAGVIIVDAKRPDWPVIYVNKAFEHITGYKAEEVINRNLRFLNSCDRNQTELQRLRDAIKNQRDATVVLRNTRKDGSEFWIELNISPIFDNAGELSHYVGVQTDITERKQMIESLTETEERYRVLVAGSAQVVWACDSLGNDIPTFKNGAGNGLTPRKAWLQQVHPDDQSKVEKMWSQTVTTRVAGECEHRFLIDGAYQVVVSKAVPLLDSQGNVREWIGVSINISDERRSQTQVLQKQKLAALSELIAGVAGEITLPLKAMACAAQHLELSHDPKTAKTGNTMLNLSRRIECVVDSLGVFARQGNEVRVEANLNHAILSIAGAFRFKLKRAEIKLELDIEEALPNCHFNVGQIEKLLINIIENSIDSLRGADTCKRLIRVATGIDQLDDGQPCVFASITDTGSGIDSDSISSIFDPFYTTKNGADSIGLGLSICHGIARAHGGTIAVESSLGHGATFVVKLPLDAPYQVMRPLAA